METPSSGHREPAKLAAHTPSPWTLREQSVGNKGSFDLEAGRMWLGTVHGDHGTTSDERGGFPDNDVAEANARLIAAAPELLAACEAAMSYIRSDCEVEDSEGREGGATRTAATLRAAIAKARIESKEEHHG